MNQSPLVIAIMGPTASGKTALSLEVARKYNGEIICLDSRTIYRGMSIGTAKPTLEEQATVPHHLIDIANPDETVSLTQIKQQTDQLIRQIHGRGRVPILVGGTALYMYVVIENWLIPEAAPDTRARAELEKKSRQELLGILNTEDPGALSIIDINNKRRIIRAIEISRSTGKPYSEQRAKGPRNFKVLKIALERDKEFLQTAIKNRTQKMLGDGLIDEVKYILGQYDAELPSMSGIHYKEVVDFLRGVHDLDTTIGLINIHDWQLTRKQMTWLKRDPEIQWIKSPKEADQAIGHFINQETKKEA